MIKQINFTLLLKALLILGGLAFVLIFLNHSSSNQTVYFVAGMALVIPSLLLIVKAFLKTYWSKKEKASLADGAELGMPGDNDFKGHIFYDKVLETTPAFITLSNAQTGDYLYVNKACEQVLGFTAAEIIKGSFAFLISLVHPDDVTALLQKNGEAIAKANNLYPNYNDDAIIEFEYRMRNKQGEYKWLHTYGRVYQRTGDLKVEKILNVSVDVTLRKEAELKALHAQEALRKLNEELEQKIAERTLELEKEKASLRKEAELNQLVLKATNDVFWDFDPHTQKVLWNGNFAFFFGEGEVPQQGGDFAEWSSRIHHADQEHVLKLITETLNDTHKYYYSNEYRFRKPDNSYAYIFDRGYILRDNEGKASRMVGCITDISKVKEAEHNELQLKKIIVTQDEQFKKILFNAPFMISIRRGPQLVMEFANKAYTDYSGRDDTGKTFEEVAGNFKKHQVYEDMWKVFHTGQTVTGKSLSIKYNRNNEKEPTESWYDYTFAPLFDVNGRVEGVATFGFDVTDLIRANKEIRQSEERFRFLADAVPHKIWTASSNGNVNYYNKGWFDFTDLSFEELQNDGWSRIVHPDDLPHTHLAWQHALETGNDLELERRMLNRDLEYRWHLVRAIAQKDEAGKVVLWVGTNTDIHDQKLVSQALEVSESYFRQLADEAPFVIWKVDEEANANYVNKTWTDFTGLSLEQSINFNWLQAVHPDDAALEAKNFQAAFKSRVPYNSKFRLRNRAGEYRWVMSQSHPIFNPAFSGYIGSLTDINDEEIAQQERTSLMQKMDEFMSIASHELKTPITSLKGYLQIAERLSEQHKEMATVHSFVAKANRQINKLTSLVGDLLDVTKINAGKMILNCSWFFMSDAIDESLEQIQQHAVPNPVIVEDNCTNIPVFADKNRLEQVLVNLLSNAIKYSPATGKVILTCSANENVVKVEVKDFGMGIAKDKIPFIFDRFFRVRETAQTQSGLGLGLYITAEIVKRHQGEIGVISEEGKGSTFWFTLPLTIKT